MVCNRGFTCLNWSVIYKSLFESVMCVKHQMTSTPLKRPLMHRIELNYSFMKCFICMEFLSQSHITEIQNLLVILGSLYENAWIRVWILAVQHTPKKTEDLDRTLDNQIPSIYGEKSKQRDVVLAQKEFSYNIVIHTAIG